MSVSKQYILSEIQRLANENNGIPPGAQRFLSETGLKQTDWHGRYWARWGDAFREGGFSPNESNAAYPEEMLLEKVALLTRKLGHVPTNAELRMQAVQDPDFPSHNTFERVGSKTLLVAKLKEFCERRENLLDIVVLCVPPTSFATKETMVESVRNTVEHGFVYLQKSGRYYKIGRSNSVGRRNYELAIQLPEKAVVVHEIRTDDPVGIEAYWHQRFADRRKNGEWFELSAADVNVFKRRKFM